MTHITFRLQDKMKAWRAYSLEFSPFRLTWAIFRTVEVTFDDGMSSEPVTGEQVLSFPGEGLEVQQWYAEYSPLA